MSAEHLYTGITSVNLDDLINEINAAGPYTSTPATFESLTYDTAAQELRVYFDVTLDTTDKAVLDGVISAHAGLGFPTIPDHVVEAAVDPTPNDDRTLGYFAGWRWLNTANNTRWTCRDATIVGGAVWELDIPLLSIEKDDSLVIVPTAIINYEGFGLSVIDEGNNKATVKYEPDASEITYTPEPDNTCWNDNLDPGQVDDALDQLACRIKGIEQGNNPSDQNFYQFSFIYGGSINNTWLDNQTPNVASNTTPHVIPYKGKIVALTFSNTAPNSDVNFKIYRGLDGLLPAASLVFTWSLTNCRTARKTDLDISVEAGDSLACYGETLQGFDRPSKVLVSVFIRVDPAAAPSDVCRNWSGDIAL